MVCFLPSPLPSYSHPMSSIVPFYNRQSLQLQELLPAKSGISKGYANAREVKHDPREHRAAGEHLFRHKHQEGQRSHPNSSWALISSLDRQPPFQYVPVPFSDRFYSYIGKLKGEDENKGMFLSVEVICLDQPEPASSSTTAYSLSRIPPLGSRASSSASTSLSPRMKEIHAKSDLSHSPLTHGLPSFLSKSSEDKVKPNFSPKARAVDPPVERERKLNTSDSSLLFSSSVSEKPAPEVESTPISSSQNVVLEPKVPVVHHNWDCISPRHQHHV